MLHAGNCVARHAVKVRVVIMMAVCIARAAQSIIRPPVIACYSVYQSVGTETLKDAIYGCTVGAAGHSARYFVLRKRSAGYLQRLNHCLLCSGVSSLHNVI
jgi:hypothetical protein